MKMKYNLKSLKNTANTVLKGKCITSNAYMKKKRNLKLKI